MNRLITFSILIALAAAGYSQEPTRWRGETQNGIYKENGLLRTWPVDGPEILWSYEGLGQGHSSAAIADGFVYTAGMIEETGIIFKFDLKGKLVWKKEYGPEFTESWYGTRGTPVIVGEKIYMESGMGKLYCFSTADGSVLWSKDLFKDFDGSNIQWGMNETPVVDGDVIYITPGGKNYNVVALNRHSGELIWSSKGKGELSAYCTPLLFEHNGRKMLATHSAEHLMGLDAKSGALLWSHPHVNQWAVHANTPVYYEGSIFYFSGYGKGGGLLKLNQDGSAVEETWYKETMDSRMGGAVVIDGYLYSSGDKAREWRCLEWETGKEMYVSKEIGKGVVIYADGMLFCYSDKGELALVKADPAGFQVLGKTKVMLGSEQHWAHPMIHDGVLYLRHGKAIIAYKISL